MERDVEAVQEDEAVRKGSGCRGEVVVKRSLEARSHDEQIE